MVRLTSLCILCLLFGYSSADEGQRSCTLSVQFTNIRSDQGKLFVFIYNYENQYPDNPYKYYEIDKKHIKNNRLIVNIHKLEMGQYALSILDDENGNDDLDMFLGIPTEGYAFSNNVKPFLSLPNYNELLFDLGNRQHQMKIEMRYAL
jgi:uncharacterized protein (DUF2141 family)